MPLRPPLSSSKAKESRNRLREPIPRPLRKMVVEFAQDLKRQHGSTLKANPHLKFQLSRLLASKLPPTTRRPGRPPRSDVSRAIRLRRELRKAYPHESGRQIWARLIRTLVPNFDSFPTLEQQEVSRQLRQRVGWRLRAQAHRRKRLGEGKSQG